MTNTDRQPASPPSARPDASPDLSRLRWRCRRGMRELDVVLQRYLDGRYPIAPPSERHAFQALLELQDPELLGYLMGRESPSDPEQANVVRRLADAES